MDKFKQRRGMQTKLTIALIVVLTIGFITTLCHDLGIIGHKNDVGVVYLQDYDCAMKLSHAKTECEAYAQVLHRVWIDNPAYVEDCLFETDEFETLNAVSDYGDTFEFWTDDDSISYYHNLEVQEEKAELYLKHRREPDIEPFRLLE